MYGLSDFLSHNLKIIFVGYNPGERSAVLNQHYAGRGNQFWKLLHDSGLTNRLYTPQKCSLLLTEGYGLTNLVPRPSKSSSDLTLEEMKEGSKQLRAKVLEYKPKIVCFLGKEVYRQYAKLKSSEPVLYGLISQPRIVTSILEFVAPNPSGRSTVPYSEKLEVFRKLQYLVNSL